MYINPIYIIERRYSNISTVWIAQTLLIQLTGVDEVYLRVKARKVYKNDVFPSQRKQDFLPPSKNNKSYRWGKQGGEFYYEYDSIPNQSPTFYASKLPSKEELLELKRKAERKEVLNPLETFFKDYVNNNYKKYSKYYGEYEQQEQLSKAATFVAAVETWLRLHPDYNHRDNSIYKELSKLIEPTGAGYLPKHYRYLKAFLQPAIKGEKSATELVQLKRAGNPNAVVFANDEILHSWLLQLRSKGRNFTNAWIIRKIEWLCELSGKDVPSKRWIGEKLATDHMKFLSAYERFGEMGKYGQQYRSSTPFADALFAGDCWQVDGSRINILNFKQKVTVVDENGKEKKLDKETYLTIVAVRDVHSGAILGHCYNLAENRWTYLEALKMAVETAGYLPYELVLDRFPGHNTEEFKKFVEDLEKHGVTVKFTHKASGKAKMERWFGTLQTVFMQDSDYYYGEGIMSNRKFAHRSKEYLKEIRQQAKNEGWNLDAAVDESNKIIEAYNTTKLSYYSRKYKQIDYTPIELHEMSEKPDVIEFKDEQFKYLFGLKRKAKIANMGLIDFEVGGVMFNYRCENYDIVSKYEYVIISYMLEDMSSINIYEISDKPFKKHLGTAQEIPAIVPYGKNAFDGYGKQQAIIKQLEDFRNQELEYKLAVGFDAMAIIQQGQINKYAYENADAQATTQLITGRANDEISDADLARSQY